MIQNIFADIVSNLLLLIKYWKDMFEINEKQIIEMAKKGKSVK